MIIALHRITVDGFRDCRKTGFSGADGKCPDARLPKS
jgi:hypothetical protein